MKSYLKVFSVVGLVVTCITPDIFEPTRLLIGIAFVSLFSLSLFSVPTFANRLDRNIDEPGFTGFMWAILIPVVLSGYIAVLGMPTIDSAGLFWLILAPQSANVALIVAVAISPSVLKALRFARIL